MFLQLLASFLVLSIFTKEKKILSAAYRVECMIMKKNLLTWHDILVSQTPQST